mgnify:CR=1 FL=1|jgi:hypothetical protein
MKRFTVNLEDILRVKSLDPGELVLKVPGTDIKFFYKNGESYINRKGNLAFVGLDIYDMALEKTTGCPEELKELTNEIRSYFDDNVTKDVLNQYFGESQAFICYSECKDGVGIITLPNILTEDDVLPGTTIVQEFENTWMDKVVAFYDLQYTKPYLGVIAKIHENIIGEREIISDPYKMSKTAINLVDIANNIYERELQLLKGEDLPKIITPISE